MLQAIPRLAKPRPPTRRTRPLLRQAEPPPPTRLVSPRLKAVIHGESLHGQGHLGNVSRTGIFVHTTLQLPDHSCVSVLFIDPDGRHIEAHGKVCWSYQSLVPASSIARRGFGMQIEVFVGPYAEFLDDLVGRI